MVVGAHPLDLHRTEHPTDIVDNLDISSRSLVWYPVSTCPKIKTPVMIPFSAEGAWWPASSAPVVVSLRAYRETCTILLYGLYYTEFA